MRSENDLDHAAGAYTARAPEQTLRPKPDSIVEEIVDGEAVIIDLETGIYYSLTGAGTVIWKVIRSGSTAADIVDAVLQRYSGDPANIEASVSDLIAKLCQEGLVTTTEGVEANGLKTKVGKPGGDLPRFEPPVLGKFQDHRVGMGVLRGFSLRFA